jgi:hypothetical protein
MAFKRLTDPTGRDISYIESFSLELHPKTLFISSSLKGDISGTMPLQARSMTGSLKLPLRAGKSAYESAASSYFGERRDEDIMGFNVGEMMEENRLEGQRFYEQGGWSATDGTHDHMIDLGNKIVDRKILRTQNDGKYASAITGTLAHDFSNAISLFMSGVNNRPSPVRTRKRFGITRFDPPFFTATDTPMRSQLTSSIRVRRRGVKDMIVGSLMPYYYPTYTNCDMSFVNYQTINFITNGSDPSEWTSQGRKKHPGIGSDIPSASVIIYPCFSASWSEFAELPPIKQRTTDTRWGTAGRFGNPNFSGPYSPHEGQFTLSFYINPRYTNTVGKHFHAGTILHLSSTYAVSLVTGSGVDQNGQASGYRIMLQLSHSADIAPSSIGLTASNLRVGSPDGKNKRYPRDLIFLTPDNSLKRNHLHHVSIQWGGKDINQGTGSFVIDGDYRGQTQFCVPSQSIAFRPADWQGDQRNHLVSHGLGDPDALFIGNYYEGSNFDGKGDPKQGGGQSSGTEHKDRIIRFFNKKARLEEGAPAPWTTSGQTFTGVEINPERFKFKHPLNAEVHDIRFYRIMLNSEQIVTASKYGPESATELNLGMYVPVFFTRGVNHRRYMVTAIEDSSRKKGKIDFDNDGMYDFVRVDKDSIEEPYNVGLSYNTGMHLVNLENYLFDFTQKVYPRVLFLTSSAMFRPPRGWRTGPSLAGGTNEFPEYNAWRQEEDNDIGMRRRNFRKNMGGRDAARPDGTTRNASQRNQRLDITGDNVSNFFYATGSFVRRNLGILPNDNGKFIPNFNLLVSATMFDVDVLPAHLKSVTPWFTENFERKYSDYIQFTGTERKKVPTGSNMSSFVDRSGNLSIRKVNIGKLIPQTLHEFSLTDDIENSRFMVEYFEERRRDIAVATSSGGWDAGREDFLPGLREDMVSPENVFGARPQDLGQSFTSLGDPLLFGDNIGWFDTADRSSDNVTMFNISNLHYGNSIQRGTFEVIDSEITGSSGKMSMRILDDANGGLYRADSLTPHAKWNTVGNLFYNEGFAIIKSPNIVYFGKDKFEMKFNGQRNIHTLTVNVPVGTAEFNSSSNPMYLSEINNFTPVSSSLNVNDEDSKFVYITGIYLHDDNYNVVMKANLAQPIMKRSTDRYMFRLKMDF